MRFISVNLLVIAFCAYSTIWTASALQCYTCTGQECQVKTFKMKTCTSSTPMSRFTRSSGYQHNKHAETNATSTTPTTTAPTTTTTPTTTTSPTTTTRPTTTTTPTTTSPTTTTSTTTTTSPTTTTTTSSNTKTHTIPTTTTTTSTTKGLETTKTKHETTTKSSIHSTTRKSSNSSGTIAETGKVAKSSTTPNPYGESLIPACYSIEVNGVEQLGCAEIPDISCEALRKKLDIHENSDDKCKICTKDNCNGKHVPSSQTGNGSPSLHVSVGALVLILGLGLKNIL